MYSFHHLNVYFRAEQRRIKLVGAVLKMIFFYLDADLVFNYAFSFKHCNKFDLCHSHLSHPSRSRFDFIVKKFPIIIANRDFVCDVCLRAK